MHRYLFRTSLLSLILTWVAVFSSSAAQDLPASDWYAVAWVQESDTLHWINAQGEQASIPRPALDNAISLAQTRLHISPNGETLAVIAPLSNGREGIGIYSFASRQFLQVHETQPNEIVIDTRTQLFTESSSHLVLPLRNPVTGDWRMIVFESATGNASTVFSRLDPDVPPNFNTDPAWFPQIAIFNLDEGTNTLEVLFQLATDSPDAPPTLPAYRWRIPAGNQPAQVFADAFPFNPRFGFDIQPMTGQTVYAWPNAQVGDALANSISTQANPNLAPQTVASEAGQLTRPRWLNGGAWVGYLRETQPFTPHQIVMNADGSSAVPLGPNLLGLWHTSDGFLTRDSQTNTLYHATSLNVEAFSAQVGNAVFQPSSSFALIYSTPAATPFTLTTLPDAPLSPVDDLVAPTLPDCGEALPPRLTIGAAARVTFTTGSPLNLRTGPAGDFVMSLAEGTQFTVSDGPICADGFNWWTINLNNNTGGWVAEADSEAYYVEPLLTVVPIQPTATFGVVQQPQLAPTATPQMQIGVITVNCNNSPAPRLTVGEFAQTLELDGTLALRLNLNDPVPTYQIPGRQTLTVLEGPRCREAITHWRVSTTLNGQTVEGWVAEGVGTTYYLNRGPARAQ